MAQYDFWYILNLEWKWLEIFLGFYKCDYKNLY